MDPMLTKSRGISSTYQLYTRKGERRRPYGIRVVRVHSRTVYGTPNTPSQACRYSDRNRQWSPYEPSMTGTACAPMIVCALS